MARSRRAPIFTDGYGSVWKRLEKRFASKTIRHCVDVPNGGAYRKVYNPWNICDFKFWAPSDKKAGRK